MAEGVCYRQDDPASVDEQLTFQLAKVPVDYFVGHLKAEADGLRTLLSA